MSWGFSVDAERSGVTFGLFSGPRAGARPLVQFAQKSSGCAVLMGRLYYRSVLQAGIKSPRAVQQVGNDAELALDAVAFWGREALQRLEGDYCLAVWDAARRMLICGRDPMGAYPLYWKRSQSGVTAATTIDALIDTRTARLDPDFVAEYLSQAFPATQDGITERTVFSGIGRVMPGHFIAMRWPNLEFEHEAAWDWREHVADPGTDQTEELAEMFRPLLRNAVRERIGQRTAAHFSGGMDSTAVALMAAEAIGEGLGEPPLHTISLVYDRIASLKRETAFIDCALVGRTNIRAHRIDADNFLSFDRLSSEWRPDEPYAALINRAQDRVMTEAAVAAGADMILTGCGGDDVFDLPPYHIADMLRRGNLHGAWHEAITWGNAYALDPWAEFCHYGLTPQLPAALQAGLGAALRKGRVNWRRQAAGTLAPWIRPGFARTYRMYERAIAQLQTQYQQERSVSLSVALASVRALAADRRSFALAKRGIMMAHPFMDSRIVSLGLGLRLRYRTDPQHQKPILAEAMRGVLPDAIRLRRGKNHFNEVYYRGLARNLPALEALIRRVQVDDLDLFDRDLLITDLRQAALGCASGSNGNAKLDLVLSFLIWLDLRDNEPIDRVKPVKQVRINTEPLHAEEARPC